MGCFLAGCYHGYDVMDFKTLNPRFGSKFDFDKLLAEANKKNIRIILDTILTHVSDDSIYFNRFGRHDFLGAYEYFSYFHSLKKKNPFWPESQIKNATLKYWSDRSKIIPPLPWYEWFDIKPYASPQDDQDPRLYDYEGWSGNAYLPLISEKKGSPLLNKGYIDYFLTTPNSVLKSWLKQGIYGYRFDAVSDLDPAVWQRVRQELKAQCKGSETALMAEVITEATHFVIGDMFDGVTNFRFRSAIVNSYLIQGDAQMADAILQFYLQNYPLEALQASMNVISSHDTPRVLSYIASHGVEGTDEVFAKDQQESYSKAKDLMKLAVAFQMGYIGVPSIYYGDEAGVLGPSLDQGRRTYPWEHEDKELLEFYKTLIAFRKAHLPLLAYGDANTLHAKQNIFAFERRWRSQSVMMVFNRGDLSEVLPKALRQLYPSAPATLSPRSFAIVEP